MSHCMIDFETLSTHPCAVVLSLGAVGFDEARGVFTEFYVNIDRQDCINRGMHVMQSTVDWWAKQSDEAKAALENGPMPLLEAMSQFSSWVRGHKLAYVWGNGADFDNPILRNCFEVLEADPPFKPYNGRCYRTIKNIPAAREIKLIREGTHHNALDDAMSQALHLLEINKAIKVL